MNQLCHMEGGGCDEWHPHASLKLYQTKCDWMEGDAAKLLSHKFGIYSHWLLTYCECMDNYTDYV